MIASIGQGKAAMCKGLNMQYFDVSDHCRVLAARQE